MEHDSSRSGYHEPEPGLAGLEEDEDWGDDEVKTFSVNLIWACAQEDNGQYGALGLDGGIPWHLGDDMRRFKELTVSHPVIMGRRTWDSLDPKFRPLSNRDNIVVSHNCDFKADGATVVSSIDEALDFARQEAIPDDGLDRSEIWVIGGAQIFKAAMPYASKAYVTYIQKKVNADTSAPDMESLVRLGDWRVESAGQWTAPSKPEDGIEAYRFVEYVRNS
ncbi:dihydrofolate reductase [Bifidobacterium bombi]|uniref:dihydrofolate reductase n=1 Tax=Bifidobacterium bombi DSM 19703 TaxID=1341695 RepID=A0A080N3F6_9BIFI|nr:dihydrofolate reductase [Bifidobacterium bombi]KFF31693.1 dihydrofolate reductase [Bifidobacterium bombi DSM 19703]